jgi:hypothetical protein
MKVHATLTIKVVYDDADSTSQVKSILYKAADHLANRGELCSVAGEIIVDTWDANVEATEEK